MSELYTIGHSNHPVERFIELLQAHAITAVCDVRSHPYSRYNPQFNRENLRRELKGREVSYVYLGKELGPRSDDPNVYESGKVQYGLLAKTHQFQQGLHRLKSGLKSHRVAVMCAEKDPIMCHRTLLICRHLRTEDIEIKHILEDGRIETNEDTETRLLRLLKIPPLQLFESTEELIRRAYDIQSEKIAYVEAENDQPILSDG
jgi:uncharacterized protein (DUF488 family)